jgi:hypothetical protein
MNLEQLFAADKLIVYGPSVSKYTATLAPYKTWTKTTPGVLAKSARP